MFHSSPKADSRLELELTAVKEATITRKYVLEARTNVPPDADFSNAVVFAQKQFLDEAEQNGYNVLVSEGSVVVYL